MTEEYLKFLGRRQELELEKKSLEIRIGGFIKNMRDALDPLTPPAELKADAIARWAVDLAIAQNRYLEVLEGLKRIKEILGK
jgi:hypothetical protein